MSDPRYDEWESRARSVLLAAADATVPPSPFDLRAALVGGRRRVHRRRAAVAAAVVLAVLAVIVSTRAALPLASPPPPAVPTEHKPRAVVLRDARAAQVRTHVMRRLGSSTRDLQGRGQRVRAIYGATLPVGWTFQSRLRAPGRWYLRVIVQTNGDRAKADDGVPRPTVNLSCELFRQGPCDQNVLPDGRTLLSDTRDVPLGDPTEAGPRRETMRIHEVAVRGPGHRQTYVELVGYRTEDDIELQKPLFTDYTGALDAAALRHLAVDPQWAVTPAPPRGAEEALVIIRNNTGRRVMAVYCHPTRCSPPSIAIPPRASYEFGVLEARGQVARFQLTGGGTRCLLFRIPAGGPEFTAKASHASPDPCVREPDQ